MNRIVIELSDRDRAVLEGLMGSVTLLATVLGSAQPESVQKEITEKVSAAFAPDHPADASVAHFDPPAPAPDPVSAAPAPAPVSLGEFQKALVTRCAESPEVKQKVQALVHKYAESVSAIPEDKRPEVLAALAQI
jgi:hypothetical protein